MSKGEEKQRDLRLVESRAGNERRRKASSAMAVRGQHKQSSTTEESEQGLNGLGLQQSVSFIGDGEEFAATMEAIEADLQCHKNLLFRCSLKKCSPLIEL